LIVVNGPTGGYTKEGRGSIVIIEDGTRVNCGEPMNKPRVFVVLSMRLLAEGIQSLISQYDDLELIGTEADLGKAIDSIRSVQPSVIIVDRNQLSPSGEITIDKLFSACPEARVIAISLDENRLDLYNRHRVIAMEVEDLIRAIRRGGGVASSVSPP